MTAPCLDRMPSPIGELLIVTVDGALCALDFADCEDRMRRLLGNVALREGVAPAGLKSRLADYLAGALTAIDDIEIKPAGTPFQHQVWSLLRTISAGRTETYGALAARLGRPRSYRAVGRANALNPISIVVPCHRLVGADGTLTGYGGGLERKRWLLEHEGVDVRG